MIVEMFRKFFGNFAAPMAIADSTGNLVEVNEGFRRLLGYSRSELLTLPVIDITHPVDVPESKALFHQAATGQTDHFQYEKRYIRKDGATVWAVVSTSWYPANDSEPRLCIGVIQDISARVSAEQACQRSEETLSTLMNNIDLGISMVDEDHNILAVNRAQAEMFHKMPADFLGKKCFRGYEKRDEICLHCPGVRAMKEGKPQVVETEGVRDDGSRFMVRIRAFPVADSDKKGRKFIEVVEDITKSRTMENELKQSQDQLNYLAHHDQLTDLPNRTLFYDRINHGIERSRRNMNGLGVVVFHLDRFKKINNSLGFEIGNQVIRAVSDRLKARLRASDGLSRIGGTAFGLVLEQTNRLQTSAKVADRILSIFDEVFAVADQEIRITPSIGISHYPEDGKDVESLITAAESARIKVRERGGNGYEYYQPSMGEEARRLLKLESRLYSALGKDEFEAHYQPQINPLTGQIIGFEALARWRDTERGLVSPADFIPIAEDSGLIIPLGRKILEIACRQAKEWLPKLPVHFRVGVNVSAVQIARIDLGQMVSDVLMQTGLPSCHLEIELTESALINDPDKALKALQVLKDMGVRVALDDFGTGYSAMSYLKNFPIDRIKIDRSFIGSLPSGTHESAIVDTIFSLGKRLGIEVLAEGVETAEQLKYLLKLDCVAVQGYYYSKPLESGSITQNLDQWFGPNAGRPFKV